MHDNKINSLVINEFFSFDLPKAVKTLQKLITPICNNSKLSIFSKNFIMTRSMKKIKGQLLEWKGMYLLCMTFVELSSFNCFIHPFKIFKSKMKLNYLTRKITSYWKITFFESIKIWIEIDHYKPKVKISKSSKEDIPFLFFNSW